MRWILASLLVVLVGCGPTTELHGTILLDDKPLEDGSISFEPVDGAGPSSGASIKEGRYEIAKGTPISPGKKRVHIKGTTKTGKQIPAGPPHPPSSKIDEVQYYPSPGEKAEVLEAEVAANQDNELNFNIETKKKK